MNAYLAGELNELELVEWNLLLNDAEQIQGVRLAMEEKMKEELTGHTYDAKRFDPLFEQVIQVDMPVKNIRKKNKTLLFRAPWLLRYAAAALVIVIAGAYAWFSNTTNTIPSEKQRPVAVNDLPPGNNKATLILSNGKKIELLHSDEKLSDRNVQINSTDGELVYNGDQAPAASKTKLFYNTMTTPRGGQYKLSLPDGTKVWLNASSSITFPTAFADSERRVDITGEVYFEVAHNAASPFYVKVQDMELKVLGTHFNINSYTDEDMMKATLLEGRVSISLIASDDNSIRQSVMLKPGQQAQVMVNSTGKKISVQSDADLEQTVAWKNGVTSFKNADIKAIMRQVARWYDVDIAYEGSIPVSTFSGEVPRQANVSKVLNILDYAGIRCRVEGKKFVVMP